MEVTKGAFILLGIISLTSFLDAEGHHPFFKDFLTIFDFGNALFISNDEIDLVDTMSKNSTTALLRYSTNKEEEQVSNHLQQLFLSGDMTMAVFIDNGHQKLLDLLINDRQLFNKGLTGLISELDVNVSHNLTLRLDSRLYIYKSEGNKFVLKETYALNGKKKVQTVGTWRESTGLIVPTKSMWERRSNLEGMSIRVATVSSPPMEILYYDKSGESITAGGGLFLEPMNILATILNFSADLRTPRNGKWGVQTNNGTWTGIIGMLDKQEADIAAADLSATEARWRVVPFGRAIAQETVTLISASNGKEGANPWIYIEIFPYNAWYLCCGIVMIISTCFYAMNYSGINLMHDHFDSENFTLLNGLGLSLTFFRQIYYNVNINRNSTKLLFILSTLSAYLLYIHYTAYLTAASTSEKEIKINSFSDVISRDYKVAVYDHGVYYDILRHAKPGTTMHDMYHKTMKKRSSAFFHSVDDAKALMTLEKTLFYGGDFTYRQHFEHLQYLNIQGITDMNCHYSYLI